eukprot:g4540.t1
MIALAHTTFEVPLLTKVAKCAAPLLPEFTPQALAITADSFAKLEVRSEILFYLLAEEILQKIPLFSGIGLVLQAYGKLGINNQKLAQACRKHVRALSDELTLWEVDAIEEGFKKMGASDGSTVALLQKVRQRLAEVDGAWVEDDLLERLAKEEELRMTKHRPEQDVEPKSIAPLQEPAPLDLWDMIASRIQTMERPHPLLASENILRGQRKWVGSPSFWTPRSLEVEAESIVAVQGHDLAKSLDGLLAYCLRLSMALRRAAQDDDIESQSTEKDESFAVGQVTIRLPLDLNPLSLMALVLSFLPWAVPILLLADGILSRRISSGFALGAIILTSLKSELILKPLIAEPRPPTSACRSQEMLQTRDRKVVV